MIPEYITKEQDRSPIISYTLNIWYGTVKESSIGKELGLLKWVTFDEKFRPGKLDFGFKNWTEKGITAICLLTRRGEFKSFEELKREYNLTNKDFFFRYLQVRDYFNKNIKIKNKKSTLS